MFQPSMDIPVKVFDPVIKQSSKEDKFHCWSCMECYTNLYAVLLYWCAIVHTYVDRYVFHVCGQWHTHTHTHARARAHIQTLCLCMCVVPVCLSESIAMHCWNCFMYVLYVHWYTYSWLLVGSYISILH